MPTTTRGGRMWGRLADAFIPGNAYNNTTGKWNPATLKTGIAGMVAGQFIPGGEAIVTQGAQRGMFGSGIQTQLRNEGITNNLADQYAAWKRQQGQWAAQNGAGIAAGSYSAPQSIASMVAPNVSQPLPAGVSGVQRQEIPVDSLGIQVANAGRGAPQMGAPTQGGNLASYMTSPEARDQRALAAHQRRGGGVMGFEHSNRDQAMPNLAARYGRL